MTNMLDCDIGGSKFELQWWYYVHFLLNFLGEGMNYSYIPQLWVPQYYYNFSTRMALALNNSQRLIQDKTKKFNQD